MDEQKEKPNKCLMCDRETHNNLKYCIFHAKAEEKKEDDFIKKLKEYINIQEEDKHYNFKYFIFIGNLNFKKDLNINILENADFEGATFLGTVDFEGVTFKEYIGFRKTCFKKDLIFAKNISQGTVNLEEITFQGNADFKEATFQGIVEFEEITFQGNADFEGAIFEKDVNFNKITFRGNADFEKVTFRGDTDFQINYLVKDINFSKINILYGKKLFLKIDNNKGDIYFERACLENVYLDIDLSSGISIDFTDVLLNNTKLEKEKIENHILQEEKKEFSKAKQVYLLLKNNFHIIGRYDDESWAFIKERDMDRKNNCHFKSLYKWLWSCFLNGIYGYGEKPERVFLSAVLVILIFTCVFMNCGIAPPVLDNLPNYNILKELSMGILYGDLLNKYKAIPREQVIESLYFSTVTFTTLGLGDFKPINNKGRIYVGLEAFTGAFMMALFVYTFARRTGGR